MLVAEGRLSVGRNTYGMPIIHDYSRRGSVMIGAYTSIARNVQVVLGGHHDLTAFSTYPFDRLGWIPRHDVSPKRGYDVSIGSDVWIGHGALILSGAQIGHGAVVGAGAVIAGNVEPYEIVVGNPARHIGWRIDDENKRASLLDSRWWEDSDSAILEMALRRGNDQSVELS